jgi:hypothetical protein
LAKVPGTPAPPKNAPEEVPVEVVPQMQPPLELVVHSAGIGLRKIDTPDGVLTLIQLMTPIGLMISLKFDEDGVEYLKQQLSGTNVYVPPKGLILPG